jgi:hypothetical protein
MEGFMKRYIPFLSAALLISLLAVPLEAKKIRYGLKIGGTWSNVWGENAPPGASWEVGMLGGISLRYYIDEAYVIQPEVFYTKKGWKGEALVSGNVLDYNTDLSYIEVPILLEYIIPTGDIYNPIIFAGPYIGFNIASTVTIAPEGSDVTEDLESVNGLDYGLVVGGGFDYEGNRGIVTIDIRYCFGLANVPDYTDEEGKNLTFKNQILAFTLGFSF